MKTTTGEEFKVWDVGGSKNMRMLWPNFYRNVDFVGVIYVVNITKSSDEKKGKRGIIKRPVDNLYKDRKELNILLNEKELDHVAWLILFNVFCYIWEA